jgi:hypothetical protein
MPTAMIVRVGVFVHPVIYMFPPKQLDWFRRYAVTFTLRYSLFSQFLFNMYENGPSQWSHFFRRWPAAAHLLGLRVRISLGHWYLCLVSVVCWQVEVSATGRSLVQRSPTECGVSECDRRTSQKRSRPAKAVEAWRKKKHVPICGVSCFRDNTHKITTFRRTSWKRYNRNTAR